MNSGSVSRYHILSSSSLRTSIELNEKKVPQKGVSKIGMVTIETQSEKKNRSSFEVMSLMCSDKSSSHIAQCAGADSFTSKRRSLGSLRDSRVQASKRLCLCSEKSSLHLRGG